MLTVFLDMDCTLYIITKYKIDLYAEHRVYTLCMHIVLMQNMIDWIEGNTVCTLDIKIPQRRYRESKRKTDLKRERNTLHVEIITRSKLQRSAV